MVEKTGGRIVPGYQVSTPPFLLIPNHSLNLPGNHHGGSPRLETARTHDVYPSPAELHPEPSRSVWTFGAKRQPPPSGIHKPVLHSLNHHRGGSLQPQTTHTSPIRPPPTSFRAVALGLGVRCQTPAPAL